MNADVIQSGHELFEVVERNLLQILPDILGKTRQFGDIGKIGIDGIVGERLLEHQPRAVVFNQILFVLHSGDKVHVEKNSYLYIVVKVVQNEENAKRKIFLTSLPLQTMWNPKTSHLYD